jgi:hypothetical protein
MSRNPVDERPGAANSLSIILTLLDSCAAQEGPGRLRTMRKSRQASTDPRQFAGDPMPLFWRVRFI